MVDAFKSYQGIVCDHSPRNKSTLLPRNYCIKHRPEPIHQAYRNHFINNITKAYRTKISDFNRVVFFLNQHYGGIVNSNRHNTCPKEFLNPCSDLFSDSSPIMLKEMSRKSIRSPSLQRSNLKQSILDFLIEKSAHKVSFSSALIIG